MVFSKKVHQRSLKGPERDYYYPRLDELERCGVIRKIAPEDVKCVSPTTLAQKPHANQGLTIEEIRCILNKQCEDAGMPAEFPDEEENLLPPLRASLLWKAATYRVCQNYGELNKVTQVAPMPQGDIRTKQQKLSGERWISIFDFAAGFYAVAIDTESQPYTAFYVEGRGFYCYCKMPFGLTGAPSCFAKMTADALGDMVGRLIELFVDDGGMAGSDFGTKLANLRTFFQRCRDTGLSLSAQKTRLFMTEAIFAGERVGREGVRGDLAKLTAVVNWGRPHNVQNLEGFIGLTGYFCSLIKDYAKLEKPLRDLKMGFTPPTHGGKMAYKKAAEAYSLKDKWTSEHDAAFIKLKAALISDPVLRAPVFDGRPFIITTDGCKDGFGGVLSQRFETALPPDGRIVERVHPIAFASKRASAAEEKYQPYLLEFAGLKFSLDKFDDTIYGFPIELETDCIALRDTLLSNKLNSTHARWRDGILAHHIVDVRHRPGAMNTAADSLSRQYTGAPKRDDDGHHESVNPDWETQRGLVNDVWTLDTENVADCSGPGWMCQFAGMERRDGDGHEWSIGDDDLTDRAVPVFSVEISSGLAAAGGSEPTERAIPVADVGISPGIFELDNSISVLRERFADEPIFLQVVDAFMELDHDKPAREKRRARHRAVGYQLDDGKLWRIGDGKTTRSRPRVECVSQVEAVELARAEHVENGHWRRDLIRLKLADTICSPRLEKSITKAILECGRCKGFGGAFSYSLLQPITRRQPMELLVGDYLAMPKGKGGYTELGVFVDVYSQQVWAFKLRGHGTAKTTLACLAHIEREHGAPVTLMTDGGTHFDNAEVREWCGRHGTKVIVVPAYSPWQNGLCEGSNSRLLGRLKRDCAPNLGEDEWAKITTFEDLPRNWPDHLDNAICSINHRIIPVYNYSPHELLTGIVINSASVPLEEMTMAPTAEDVHQQLALTQQQCLDAYSHIVEKSNDREASFNESLDRSQRKKAVEFAINTLVQVYRSDLDYTFKTERKLLPKWGPVRRIIGRNRNSYKIATLEGLVLKGWFSARRLREFEARAGTELDAGQKALSEAIGLIQARAGIPTEQLGDVPEDGEEGEPDGPRHERDSEADQDALAREREAARITSATSTGPVRTDTAADDEDIEPDEETEEEMDEVDELEEHIDDGMVLGGWSAPGRLRKRHSRQE